METSELVLEGVKDNKGDATALDGVVKGDKRVLDLLDLLAGDADLRGNKGVVSVSACGTSSPFGGGF